MSTILKALRRLEEEGEQANQKHDSKMALDPSTLSSDALREGIFAEEVASEAVASAKTSSGFSRTAATSILAVCVLSVLAWGVTRVLPEMISARKGEEEPLASASSAAVGPETESSPDLSPPSSSSAAEFPARLAQAETVMPVQQVEPPQPSVVTSAPPSSGLARAAVRPTPAAAALTDDIDQEVISEKTIRAGQSLAESARERATGSVPRSAPVAQVAKRTSLSAPAPAPAPAPAIVQTGPIAALSTNTTDLAESSVSEAELPVRKSEKIVAEPLPTRPRPVRTPTPAAVSAERSSSGSTSTPERRRSTHHARDLASVSVERTSWHPRPERRTAKVRVSGTGEVLSLSEGDFVRGMTVQEITPSSVIFDADGVEVRRRVGSDG